MRFWAISKRDERHSCVLPENSQPYAAGTVEVPG